VKTGTKTAKLTVTVLVRAAKTTKVKLGKAAKDLTTMSVAPGSAWIAVEAGAVKKAYTATVK
jgi:hypothetical protein